MKQLLLIAVGIGVMSWCGMAQSAEVLFGAGQHQEEVEGNLQKAIRTYQQVLAQAGADRSLAARAQLRIGMSYEKLGRQEAAKAYQSVVRDYADQPEVVRQAQARLAGLRPADDSMALRKVWDGIGDTISPDGRFVTYTNWTKGGDLVIRDLTTGTTRWLTDRKEPSAPYVDGSIISPDGRDVAYLWIEKGFEVRILPLEGGATARIVYSSPNYLFIRAWTPDGQNLLVTRSLDDGTWQIAMLSVRDGSVRQLKSFKWGQVDASISPDGRYIAYDAPTGNGPSRDIFVLAADGSQESPVVQHPANDHSTVWSPDGSRILFVSNRTATPSLWSVPVKDGKPAGAAELVKSDIGAIRPLRMTRTGTLYYMVSGRSRLDVYRAPLAEDGRISGPPEVVTDRFVNSNWGGTLSPNGEQIAYYSDRPDTVLVVRNLSSGQERVYPLDFEIRRTFFLGASWLPEGRSVLVTARENQRPGLFLYRVDLATGKAEEAGRDIGYGLKAAPDGKAVYYVKESSTRLVRFDLANGRETVVRAVSQEPGEHVGNPAISPDGKQLAYLRASGDERLVEVMALPGGEPRVVFQEPRPIGSSHFNTLTWTPDQRYLLFVKDEEGGSSIWRVPASGGEAERIGVSMNARIKAPQIHPDGRSIFFNAVEADKGQIWALENFLPAQTARR